MKKKSLIKRTALGIVIFGMTIMVGVAIAAGIQMYNGALDLYTNLAYSFVIPTAEQFSPDAVKKLIAAGDEYSDFLKYGTLDPSSSLTEDDLTYLTNYWYGSLSMMASVDELNEDIVYFYVVIPTEEDLIYLWDTDQSDGELVFPMEHVPYEPGEKEYLMSEMNGTRTDYSLAITDYGHSIIGTAYKGIVDENGDVLAIVAMDISMSSIRLGLIQMIINIAVITTIIVVAACIFYYLSMRKRIILPLVTMKNAAAGLVDNLGNESCEDLRIDVHTGDEIEEVARSFEEMDKRLKIYIRENEAAAAEKERFATEMNLAARIQLGMLPDTAAVFSKRNEIDISASINPAKAVGGDFYDFFFLDETHLALVMADVSGKGVPAALFMTASKIQIRNYTRAGLSPSAVFEKINTSFVENNTSKTFVTVWLGILDLDTGVLKAANAGHEYPVIRRGDGRVELYKDRHSFVIGAMPGIKYKEYEMTLLPGEGLFLYTDGVPEASNSKKEKFGTARMVETLQNSSGSTPDQVLGAMDEALLGFVKDAEQFDDITMMCFLYK